jgi:hypothetical protein
MTTDDGRENIYFLEYKIEDIDQKKKKYNILYIYEVANRYWRPMIKLDKVDYSSFGILVSASKSSNI